MKLIIMHGRDDAKAEISIEMRWLIVAACVFLVISMALGAMVQRLVWSMYPVATSQDGSASFSSSGHTLTHEAAQALAVKVGELQASLSRLDVLGRRVAEVAGLPTDRISFVQDMPEAMVVLDEILAPTDAEAGRAPASDLERQINEVQASLSRQSDYFLVLDMHLTGQIASVGHLPTTMPVGSYPYLSSSFGWRRHPFNGQISMHEGLDFSAPTGTPIRAAAGGVIRTVASHPGYGNMVEIDHGEGLLTRYAHAQTILVSEGALVTRGQMIAKVGSTGLSTGPHLHFEVRKNDKAMDPRLFLTGQPLIEAVARAPVRSTPPGVAWRPRLR